MTFLPRELRRDAKQSRFADVAPQSYDKKSRTVEAVISLGSAVQRWYGTEKLRISADAVDLSRLSTSGIPLLDSHAQLGIDNALGRFTNVWIGQSSGSQALLGRIAFNDTPRGRRAEGMVSRGEIKGISAGYQVDEWEITDKDGRVIDPEVERIRYDEEYTFTATKWRLNEGSLVSVPADAPAMVRSFGTGADRAPPGFERPGIVASARARAEARQRMVGRMRDLGQPQQQHAPEDDHRPPRSSRVDQPETDEMNHHFSVIRDEREGVAAAMEIALTQRILSSRGSSSTIDYKPRDAQEQKWLARHQAQSAQYRDKSLIELAADCIGHRQRGFLTPVHAGSILERAFNSTSDFPSIFMNALNKALLARYQLHVPTYRESAAERTFVDFRPHPQVRAGDFPTLKPVLETGELQYGSTTDNNEPISVQPYGIIFSISRTMLVNDDLGGIDQILGSAGDMVLVFENTTFYTMFKSNPVLNQDNTAVFASGHGNLAGAGADPSVATIGAGRQALREMTTISGNLINVPPSIIFTGPAQETNADTMVATITPTLTTSVNPFSGRLRSVSDANITDNSWYLIADPARVPNFVYGFLAGTGGPRTRTFEPFGVQGVKISLEHDFGVGAVDFRGGYKFPAH